LRFYAIKILNKERVVKMKQVEHTNNEQRVLECVQHPFIVNLWGYFQDSANLYMLMDFVPGGELFTLLRRSRVSLRNAPGRTIDLIPHSGSQTLSQNSTLRRSGWL
jgi:serine/threonine protein kinase